MTLPISSNGAATALPAVNIHPHGHRRGSLDSADESSSNTAAQIPVGSTQNLFGSLLSSLEQIIGVQPAHSSSTASSASTPQAAASAASPAAQSLQGPLTTMIGSKISLIA
jgi:hypothetical protein